MTIRGVPDDLYRAIAARARRNRRSLQQEALALLERARVLEHGDVVGKARAIRQRLAMVDRGDTLQEIREERER